jgi:hypothetical protein
LPGVLPSMGWKTDGWALSGGSVKAAIGQETKAFERLASICSSDAIGTGLRIEVLRCMRWLPTRRFWGFGAITGRDGLSEGGCVLQLKQSEQAIAGFNSALLL